MLTTLPQWCQTLAFVRVRRHSCWSRNCGTGYSTTVVGVPIGTDEYVNEHAMKVVKEGGADKVANNCLACPKDK